MNRFLSLILIISLLVGLLTGCSLEPIGSERSSKEKTPADTVEQEPEKAPEITPAPAAREVTSFGLSWHRDEGFNPYSSTSISNQAALSLMYEALFVNDNNFNPQPVLCSRYAVSDDRTVWKFEIYNDVDFSDGTRMTSEDVVSSLTAAMESSLFKVRFRFVKSIYASGTYTFTISLYRSCENLALLLDIPIVKASTVKTDYPVGSGPYYKRGSKLYPNDRWWQKDPVVDVDVIKLIEVGDSDSIRDEFEFGEVDVVYTDPYALYNAQYHGDNEPWAINTCEMQYLGFNQKSLYCSSSNLRAAITYLVDRATIIAKIYNGYGVAASIPCAPSSGYYDAGLSEEYAFNPEKFRELYGASGISADPSNPMILMLSNNNTHRLQAAQYIAETLSNYGLYTEVRTTDHNNFLYDLSMGEWDLYLSEIRLPPNMDLNCFFTSGYYTAVGGLSSETSRELMNNAIENSGNYYDLFRTVMSRGLLCPIMFKVNVLYTSRGTLGTNAPSVSNFLQNRPTSTMDAILDRYEGFVKDPVG